MGRTIEISQLETGYLIIVKDDGVVVEQHAITGKNSVPSAVLKCLEKKKVNPYNSGPKKRKL